ncbi:ATP-dependent helicase HrpB [Sedimenticola selenatireducens]|uniref:ATP-dependent helicase HrpB n=1 Tax=Sedimenticola selenatireducens TaxID=191960 RepID=A0A558DVC7_9GAMM|nr:ATP-dependent helicase HrpB [Sedimenticola selenatireducens]TVO77633.1 ATP-dependent helicase HrpB [Sedimenticola selenatireducens]TVT64939.1 MAG: ATP-dependent helicase HrpB [Sedimenticola selenatireducens]
MLELPITPLLPGLAEALETRHKVVLAAPPGSGKTTLVPLALIKQSWLEGKQILMLEPRRLAARAAAQRMAQLLNEKVGERVGYQVRFDRQVSSKTRIEVVTEGILTRRLQDDPELASIGLIIFDEFHERSLQADLSLAFTLDVIQNLREDLRLLVMSATLDTDAVSTLLGGAPVITAEGQSFPVECRYLERASQLNTDDLLVSGVLRAVRETAGDILVFLPGTGEIRRAEAALKQQLPNDVKVLPLYGELSRAEQDAVLTPQPDRRRIILSTSIAETSLTIEGVTTVVDSGWSRRPRFDPNSGLTRLETIRVSKASATQRAGRAGRQGPGVCYRLWSLVEEGRLPAFHPPELIEADLAPMVLELALWGVSTPSELQWLDMPPAGAFAQAQALLQRLDALDVQNRITKAGQHMVGLALHPRLAHMLSSASGERALALDLAGLLSERDILRRVPGEIRSIDIVERIQLLMSWRKSGRQAAHAKLLDLQACKQVDRAIRQWGRRLQHKQANDVKSALGVGGLLALAFPDRIAKRASTADSRYLLVTGRAVQLPEGDPLSRHEYLVIAAMDAGKRDGRAYLAAPIAVDQIRETQETHIQTCSRVTWDPANRAVLAREEERLGAVVLSARLLPDPEFTLTCEAMLSGIRQMGIVSLPWSDETLQWRERVASVREWLPNDKWPDLSDVTLLDQLEAWLAPWLKGVTRVDYLKKLDLGGILKSMLSWEQQKNLDKLAPTHLDLPCGTRKRIEYHAGQPPILAVKLQALFGLQQTPTLCNGTVPVILHLLSPAQRPIQVTQDLAGFWQRTYAEVRKELKGRYPKHYWPEDPYTAVPTSRVRPKNK